MADNGCGPFGGGPAGPGSGLPRGMAASPVHLMLVSLNINDSPVGYSPPVGPPVWFTVRYNQRDAFQAANFTHSNFGPKWTCDWISYITDSPSNSLGSSLFSVAAWSRQFQPTRSPSEAGLNFPGLARAGSFN